jgi:hypothetical protein
MKSVDSHEKTLLYILVIVVLIVGFLTGEYYGGSL